MTDQVSLDPAKLFASVASRPGAVIAAVLGNLIPVYAVVQLGWDPGEILILYWLENVILGLFALSKIRASRRGEKGTAGLPALFVLHYGVFCAGHLVFVLVLADSLAQQHGASGGGLDRAFAQAGFGWAVLGLLVINGLSQWWDWWIPERWLTSDPRREMVAPYGRIVVLHLTLLIGTGLMVMFNAPAGTILILCLMKAVLEIVTIALKDVLSATPRPG